MNIAGMRVISSVNSFESVAVKKHKRTRSQSESYHERISKKWRKRYGTKLVPGAYIADLAMMGLGVGKCVIAHPEIIDKLRAK